MVARDFQPAAPAPHPTSFSWWSLSPTLCPPGFYVENSYNIVLVFRLANLNSMKILLFKEMA
jgi:hypothetical protein